MGPETRRARPLSEAEWLATAADGLTGQEPCFVPGSLWTCGKYGHACKSITTGRTGHYELENQADAGSRLHVLGKHAARASPERRVDRNRRYSRDDF